MIVEVVFKEQAFQIHVKALCVAFSEDHLRQNACLIINARGQEQIEISGVEVSV